MERLAKPVLGSDFTRKVGFRLSGTGAGPPESLPGKTPKSGLFRTRCRGHYVSGQFRDPAHSHFHLSFGMLPQKHLATIGSPLLKNPVFGRFSHFSGCHPAGTMFLTRTFTRKPDFPTVFHRFSATFDGFRIPSGIPATFRPRPPPALGRVRPLHEVTPLFACETSLATASLF